MSRGISVSKGVGYAISTGAHQTCFPPQISFRKMMLKHGSQYGWSPLWKNDGFSKGFSQLYHDKVSSILITYNEGGNKKTTDRTNKTPPTPFPSKRPHRLVSVPDTPLTPLAFWEPQPDMACLAVWMSAEHREPHIVRLKVAVSAYIQLACASVIFFGQPKVVNENPHQYGM
jgi:hypothetical protein